MSDPIITALAILSQTDYPATGGALPAHYDPDISGPAYVVTVKGGSPHTEIPYRIYYLMVDTWAGINKFADCRQAYEEARHFLHGLANEAVDANNTVILCLETGVGQDQYDQETGWCRNVSTYEMWLVDGPVTIQKDNK